MSHLTLDQLTEGRRLVTEAFLKEGPSGTPIEAMHWLSEHAEALFDAAEWVARQEAAELAELQTHLVVDATAPIDQEKALRIAVGVLRNLVAHPDVRNEYLEAARRLEAMVCGEQPDGQTRVRGR